MRRAVPAPARVHATPTLTCADPARLGRPARRAPPTRARRRRGSAVAARAARARGRGNPNPNPNPSPNPSPNPNPHPNPSPNPNPKAALGLATRRALGRIVLRASATQSLKGILTAGGARALQYLGEKVSKRFK